MVQFASYLRRVLCKMRLIFPRINGPSVLFCYRRTIRLKQENFSCNNETNYTRRHKFITYKNNCCQVFSRSCNNQPLFVNKYKFKVGWQSPSLKDKFSGFRRAKQKHLFIKSQTILHDFLRTCTYFLMYLGENRRWCPSKVTLLFIYLFIYFTGRKYLSPLNSKR